MIAEAGCLAENRLLANVTTGNESTRQIRPFARIALHDVAFACRNVIEWHDMAFVYICYPQL